jgi:PAS domain S-box-containing protein
MKRRASKPKRQRATEAKRLQRVTAEVNEQLVMAGEAVARELAEKARLLDLTNDAIVVRGPDNKISVWNKGAEKLYGWTCEEVIGKDLHSLLQTQFPKPMEEILAQLHREGSFSGEVLQIGRDGRRIHSLCRWVLDRATQSILTSYTDITERKKMEEALRQAQAELADRAGQLERLVAERTATLQETIGELEGFSYSITHDLRAPLRAMQSFALLLEESYRDKLDDTAKDWLRRIRASADRMDKLIQDVLAYSRVLRLDLRMEKVDADKLLRGMLESYPAFQEPKAEVVIEGRLPSVLANEAALTQCFSNLLNNAVKFVVPGTKPRVRICAERRGEMTRFWVHDNGIGISERHRDSIFGMFERLDSSYEGTGIGLTITRKAIERMGGSVGVQSEPGQGSRFWIELKAA